MAPITIQIKTGGANQINRKLTNLTALCFCNQGDALCVGCLLTFNFSPAPPLATSNSHTNPDAPTEECAVPAESEPAPPPNDASQDPAQPEADPAEAAADGEKSCTSVANSPPPPNRNEPTEKRSLRNRNGVLGCNLFSVRLSISLPALVMLTIPF